MRYNIIAVSMIYGLGNLIARFDWLAEAREFIQDESVHYQYGLVIHDTDAGAVEIGNKWLGMKEAKDYLIQYWEDGHD